MTTEPSRALVLLPACSKTIDGMAFHAVGDKYVHALAEAAGVQPLLLPNLAELADSLRLLDRVDVLSMTGSPSNVHPGHFDRPDLEEASKPHDPARNAVSLDPIRAALERGLPLLCICRGFQELHVALGGSIFPRLHEVEGLMDHRSLASGERVLDYGPRHDLTLAGWFAEIFASTSITVNSLHHQGIETLAAGLITEGWAPGSTVEAVRVAAVEGFAVGVRWHPEYCVMDNPQLLLLFQAFGQVVAARQAARLALAA